jgi:Xaa-Pro aminopeptidase
MTFLPPSPKSSEAVLSPPAKASHDSPYPPALLDFMMRDWKVAPKKLPPQVKGLARFQARRAAVSAAYPGETLIIPTGHEKVRANDTHYHFRPGSDFYYLTGNLEADCVLILVPKGKGHESLLFVEPNPGRSDSTFFTDRNKGELWVGPRLGIEESRHRYGVERCAGLKELPTLLESLGKGRDRAFRVVRGLATDVDGALPPAPKDAELATFLSEMRLLKDSLEIAALKRACASTRRGFEDIIRVLEAAKSEREVEGAFNSRARIEGNDVGYNTIAACGAHACVLHWTRNSGKIGPNELILVDAGVESHELYTADVTRTLPVRGKFKGAQREVYELVLAAQAAAFAVVKPGNDFMAPNRAAMEVLAQGLEDMGILASAQEALEPEKQYYKRYTLHNVSHMLGIDVHDCAQARAQAYKFGALKAGMVLTVEPGLYFQKDDLTVPARYRGIGVRIEDDVLVTARGYQILSDLPRAPKDVEKWMASVWKRKK